MRNIKWMTGLPFELPPIKDVTELLKRHNDKHYETRSPDSIDTIIVHHMASDAPISNQAAHHVNNKGWPAIGYHLCIDNDRLLQTNDLAAASYHTAGWNHRSVGIAIRGDLTKRPMTDIERMLLYGAILTVKSIYSIKQILGHNEASKLANKPGTLCPATDCNRIRQDVLNLENQMAYEKSPEAIRTKAYAVANNVSYLYNMANGKDEHGNPANPQQQEWAVRMLIRLFPAFKDAGLLQ